MPINTTRIVYLPVLPKCDQSGCAAPARYRLVWTKPQHYCEEHALKVLAIGEAMGYPTPGATIERLELTPLPMITDEWTTDEELDAFFGPTGDAE